MSNNNKSKSQQMKANETILEGMKDKKVVGAAISELEEASNDVKRQTEELEEALRRLEQIQQETAGVNVGSKVDALKGTGAESTTEPATEGTGEPGETKEGPKAPATTEGPKAPATTEGPKAPAEPATTEAPSPANTGTTSPGATTEGLGGTTANNKRKARNAALRRPEKTVRTDGTPVMTITNPNPTGGGRGRRTRRRQQRRQSQRQQSRRQQRQQSRRQQRQQSRRQQRSQSRRQQSRRTQKRRN